MRTWNVSATEEASLPYSSRSALAQPGSYLIGRTPSSARFSGQLFLSHLTSLWRPTFVFHSKDLPDWIILSLTTPSHHLIPIQPYFMSTTTIFLCTWLLESNEDDKCKERKGKVGESMSKQISPDSNFFLSASFPFSSHFSPPSPPPLCPVLPHIAVHASQPVTDDQCSAGSDTISHTKVPPLPELTCHNTAF